MLESMDVRVIVMHAGIDYPQAGNGPFELRIPRRLHNSGV